MSSSIINLIMNISLVFIVFSLAERKVSLNFHFCTFRINMRGEITKVWFIKEIKVACL